MFFFFFNDTATTEIYTLSLHDALPICPAVVEDPRRRRPQEQRRCGQRLGVRGGDGLRGEVGLEIGERVAPPVAAGEDRKSTRLNSSHAKISYAVFCLEKKKKFLYLPSF